jgi:hypothetical protein
MLERGGWVAVSIACGVLGCMVAGAGCGQPESGRPPDGAVPDTTPPKIVSLSPSTEPNFAPVLSKLTATFDEPLDPTTVTAANLRLTARLDDSTPTLPGTVSYDEMTNTITFTPLRPFEYDSTYRLHIGAVTDASGNAFEGTTFQLHTVVNAITRETVFTNNQISGYVENTLDTFGRPTIVVATDSDRDPISHEEYNYLATGEWQQYRRYDKGADNKWNTNDDPVVVRDEYTYDMTDDVRLVSLAEFADDQTSRLDYTWTDRNLTIVKVFDNAGNDAMWNTPDDRGPQWREYGHDALGAITRRTLHNNGGDGLAGTSDDFITSSTVYDFDPTTYASTKQTLYGGPGLDMTWLTDDDVVGNYTTFTNDNRGMPLTRVGYASKGDDMTWFTSDDVINSRQTFTYNVNGLETNRDNFSGAGTDGMWGTNDDELSNYTTSEYDATGNRTKQIIYIGAGTDGMWHTSDDLKTVERAFDLTH